MLDYSKQNDWKPGVEWLVVTSADLTLNQGQLDWFTKHFPVNARRVQPLQKRPI
ncbi:hypothetical protein [Fructilactobacillus sanfranciscensis]|uniref:hypothetical protein n=1 Tax=Fructilactobacillus sanfranciscensis TaxID=1625 RepID=UPI0013D1970D|nr:hypothetical protein [Fructilactobacillus sanfranciscensis]